MSTPAQRLLTITDTDGIAHLVSDEYLIAGHRTGRYLTLCAQQVLTASLTTLDHEPCPGCSQRKADL